MAGELISIYYAADIGEADIIIAWLDEQGIQAQVKDRLAAGVLAISQIVAPRGVEVCVSDSELADRARSLLRSHRDEIARRRAHHRDGAPLEAICEACGGAAHFARELAGSVQICPHCREYLDVPNNTDQ